MKKTLLFLFVLMLSTAALFAQAPQKMSYQAVVRNANNTLVTSQNVSARISILQGSVNGTPVYVEIHNATTNVNGLLTLEVGEGNVVSGSMAGINWANGPFFLKSEIDPNGGVNYSIEGTQQLMSVPYALYAGQAGNVPAFGITPVDTTGYIISITQPGGQPQTFMLSNGMPGPQGLPGNDGRGIVSITGPVSNDIEDTYTIHYSDNTTSTFTVTNGTDGEDGAPGTPGTPGAPGFSPTITVTSGTTGMVLTITDANGTNQYTIPNGSGSGSGGTFVQQQVNWNETDSTSVTYILNKPALATVATSGSYNDLTNKPTIPTNLSQLTNDAGFVTSATVPVLNVTQTDTGYVLTVTENGTTQTYVLRDGHDGTDGLPGTPGTPGNGISGIAKTGTAGNVDTYTITYTNGTTTTFNVTNGVDGSDGVSPTIALDTLGSNLLVTITDASGTNTTLIPLSTGGGTFTQLPADWNATSGVQQILHKPTNLSQFNNDLGLATVATSGSYNDLTNKPTIPTVPANVSAFTNDAGYITMDSIPAIPDAQVNADWNATSGVAEILHKPDIAGMQNAIDSMQNVIEDLQDDMVAMSFVCGVSTVKDYDGNEYNTVKIGNQCWIKENLRATHFNDGTAIMHAGATDTSTTIPMYYQNGSVDVNTYGLYYNWPVAHGGTGALNVCPRGWHVPVKEEFTQLTDFVSSQGRYVCGDTNINISRALASTTGWNTSSTTCSPGNNQSDNNATGFSAFPAGYYNNFFISNNYSFYEVGATCEIWANSSHSQNYGVNFCVYESYKYAFFNSSEGYKTMGRSIRCLRDPETSSILESLQDELQNFMEEQNASNFVCGVSTVKDYDGNEYNTVKIGDQCWTKENLRTMHFNDGTTIMHAGATDASLTIPMYYQNGSVDVNTYGLYYNWIVANGGADALNNVCPQGWHVPVKQEFTKMNDFVRGQSEYVCGDTNINIGSALASTTGWNWSSTACSPGRNQNDNNATGFSAFPAGNYNNFFNFNKYSFCDVGATCEIWANSSHSQNYGVSFYLYKSREYASFNSSQGYKTMGRSIRCLRDSEIPGTIESLQNSIYELQDFVDDLSASNFICGASTVKDYDGNRYNTVKIGEQCWMRENLKTTHYSDGTEIPFGTDTSASIGYRYYPERAVSNVPEYGYLYNWFALMNGSASSNANPSGVQGVCPTGWHVPSPNEWVQLQAYMQSQSQYRCHGTSTNIAKALADKTGWNPASSPDLYCAIGVNPEDNNASGFGARPAGWLSDGSYDYGVLSESALFCTSYSYINSTYGTVYSVYGFFKSDSTLRAWSNPAWRAHSVRCLRDPESSSGSSAVINLHDSLATVAFTGDYNNLINTPPIPTVNDATLTIKQNNVVLETFSANESTDKTVNIVTLTIAEVQNMINSSIAPLQNSIDSLTDVVDDLNDVVDSLNDIIGDRPTVVINYFYGGDHNSAGVQAEVTNMGSDPILVKGICWSTAHNPTLNNNYVIVDTTTEEFMAKATNLNFGTTYYIRAFATNASGTAYSEEQAFTPNYYAVPDHGTKSIYVSGDTWIYDYGGPDGVYDYNWDGTLIINCNVSGKKVVIEQGTYDIENNYDKLYVYSGTSATGTPIATFTGNDGTIPLTSPNVGDRHLCLKFTSDVSVHYDGFAMKIKVVDAPCGTTRSVSDYDDNSYNLVEIGQQCWMKENLRTTHFSNGVYIDLGTTADQNTAYRYYPNNNSSNVATYGYLYNWAATMHGASSSTNNPSGVQGICPTGWHVPSQSEWQQLSTYLRSVEDYVCGGISTGYNAKAIASKSGWNTGTTITCAVGNDLSANNASGFTAYPAGLCTSSTAYTLFGNNAYFQTATQSSSSASYTGYITYTNVNMSSQAQTKMNSYSVRCIKN